MDVQTNRMYVCHAYSSNYKKVGMSVMEYMSVEEIIIL